MAEEFITRLEGVPVELALAALEYGDAVLREMMLVAFDPTAAEHLGKDWRPPSFPVQSVLDLLYAARERGEQTTTLELSYPYGTGDLALERYDAVETGARLSERGVLLLPPPVPEISQCRQWVYAQIARQEHGEAPERWQLEASGRMRGSSSVTITEEEAARFEAADAAVVAADERNRIIYVNSRLSEQLGWNPENLVDHRLLILIPPELREAHLAGFTRYLMTGEPRLLGRTVNVPVLRGDGSRLDAELRVESMRSTSGPPMYVAFINAAGATGSQDGPSST